MANEKNTIVIYKDWKNIFEKLTNEEAGQLIKHLFRYLNGENPESDRLIELVFEPIKITLKRDLKHWETVIDKRKEAGKIGGFASGVSRKQNEANEANASKTKQNEANEADSVSDTVSVIVSDTVIDSEKKKRKIKKEFSPPLEKEVIDFFKENGYSEESAKKAFQYYSIADWNDSKNNKVKNWKQKMISVWFKEENKIKQNNGTEKDKPNNGMFANIKIH